jgi:hypothetical protein
MLIQNHIHEHMGVNTISEGSFRHRDPRVSSNWSAELALHQERRFNKKVNFKSYTIRQIESSKKRSMEITETNFETCVSGHFCMLLQNHHNPKHMQTTPYRVKHLQS